MQSIAAHINTGSSRRRRTEVRRTAATATAASSNNPTKPNSTRTSRIRLCGCQLISLLHIRIGKLPIPLPNNGCWSHMYQEAFQYTTRSAAEPPPPSAVNRTYKRSKVRRSPEYSFAPCQSVTTNTASRKQLTTIALLASSLRSAKRKPSANGSSMPASTPNVGPRLPTTRSSAEAGDESRHERDAALAEGARLEPGGERHKRPHGVEPALAKVVLGAITGGKGVAI